MKDKASDPIVAIDFMILVWGIRKTGTREQLQRARWLFQKLEEEEAQVILSSVALAEYLTPVPPDEHRDVIAALTKRFIVPPFDVRCASLAASLFAEGKNLRQMDKRGARK
ncbi:MAG: hypothetical protein HY718_07360 [Planctomycetes bacterium]|nr:hypothetical protein [Planctomycetota bacterium]